MGLSFIFPRSVYSLVSLIDTLSYIFTLICLCECQPLSWRRKGASLWIKLPVGKIPMFLNSKTCNVFHVVALYDQKDLIFIGVGNLLSQIYYIRSIILESYTNRYWIVVFHRAGHSSIPSNMHNQRWPGSPHDLARIYFSLPFKYFCNPSMEVLIFIWNVSVAYFFGNA